MRVEVDQLVVQEDRATSYMFNCARWGTVCRVTKSFSSPERFGRPKFTTLDVSSNTNISKILESRDERFCLLCNAARSAAN